MFERGCVRVSLALLAVFAGAVAPRVAHARHIVFAETWENGTANWRTQTADGGDCKGWPVCPFAPSQTGPTFPAALKGNQIIVHNGDGDGNRDLKTCSGAYVNIPRAYAGWDAANYTVTGAVTQGGISYKNAQFPVKAGDKLCVVAWVRAWPEVDGAGNPTEAGPYIGINYTGAHGVVDAGHNHCTHYMIGPAPFGEGDPEVGCNWRAIGGTAPTRPVYSPVNGGPQSLAAIITDGKWHRYKQPFTTSRETTTLGGDVADPMIAPCDNTPGCGPWREWQPEFSAGTTWTDDVPNSTVVYGQPRIILYGKPPERTDVPAGTTPIQHDADIGDIMFFKADVGDADPCPTDAELDALAWASDHVECGPGKTCQTTTAAMPAWDRTSAYPANTSSVCFGCSASFGAAAAGPTTCGQTTPFCLNIDARRGGTCTACGGDAASGADASVKCADPNPTCLTEGANAGACAKCATDADCANPAHAGPTCDPASGACFACDVDNGVAGAHPCPASEPVCNTTNGQCGKCTGAADCAGATHLGPMCDVTGGACGKCDGDLGTSTTAYACTDPANPNCHADGTCAKCTSNADCTNPPGEKLHSLSQCNPGTGACEGPPADVTKCDGDKGVSTTSLGCSSATAPTCMGNGLCAKCTADSDCVNPPGQRMHANAICDLANGACDQGPAADVPPAEDANTGGCTCRAAPSSGDYVGALLAGVVALALRARRKQRDDES